MGQSVYAIDGFPDDDLLWRIEWLGGVGYNTSVPSEPQIDVSLAQLPKGERNPLSGMLTQSTNRLFDMNEGSFGVPNVEERL